MTTDTPWSDPGYTAGKPDRYQSRWYRGCFLSAGSNARHPDGRHIGGDSAPWTVEISGLTEAEAKALVAHLETGDPTSMARDWSGLGDSFRVRTGAVAADQASARAAAMRAADAAADRLAAIRASEAGP